MRGIIAHARRQWNLSVSSATLRAMAEFTTWRARMGGRNAAPVVDHPGLGWWREARFGMFIHWGLYAIPAGVWKGEPVDGIGEWIMFRRRIPRAEYEPLARQFNPVRFDAKAWVDLAVQAGMRYLVITAKHHDGFALYHSPCCPYNIVDATPYGRDPLAELADACRDAGIALGFYYSQDQDWHDPGGSRNDWDFAPEEKDFGAYLERKVKPQLRELLTGYGPVGLIWFDTPYSISREHSIELRDFVHRLQPDCLVSGRIGNDVGDYGSLGDNQIPAGRVQADYETPATLNDTWGYKTHDHNWKSVQTLLLLLIDLASKGVNYLLNVGPTAEGVIPEPSAERLRAIGAWLQVNGEAIYGTQGSPFPYEHDGLRMTAKPGCLYLHLLQPAQELVVHGLRSRVTGARLLGSASQVRFEQGRSPAGEVDRLRVGLPDLSGCEPVAVIALDLAGDAEADPLTVQQPDGAIHLHAHLASVAKEPDSTLEVLSSGMTAGWMDTASELSWQVKVCEPGSYEVTVITAPRYDTTEVDEHHLEVAAAGSAAGGPLRAATAIDTARSQYFPEYAVALGRVEVGEPGTHRFTLRAIRVVDGTPDGVTVFGATLRPA